MNKKKRILVIGLILLLILGPFLAVQGWRSGQKYLIRSRVLADMDGVTALAEAALATGNAEANRPVWAKSGFADKEKGLVLYRVAGLWPREELGLLYSADGVPKPCPGMEDYEEVVVMFGFRWQAPSGSEGCYLENITDDLYTYEAW